MSDTYGYANADIAIARFALPLIKELREKGTSYPSDLDRSEQWDTELAEITFALEQTIIFRTQHGAWLAVAADKELLRRVQTGLELLGKRFIDLWD